MISRYVLAAALLIFFVFLSYVGNFYYRLNYSLSTDTAVWGQLGDYAGGLLNPLFSFITLVLLIKSLSLQNEANEGLRDEIKNTRKTEKLRSFEAQLFNMINSQKTSFESLKIQMNINGENVKKYGAAAIIEIEGEIERLRFESDGDEYIVKFLEGVDSSDQIFGATRMFYIMVKMITEKLSDSNGFDINDRSSHFTTLINFTDFSLLRLIIISMQFMSYPSTEYLKGNKEFNSVLEELGLGNNLY